MSMTATQTVAAYWYKDLSIIEAHLPMELGEVGSASLGSVVHFTKVFLDE